MTVNRGCDHSRCHGTSDTADMESAVLSAEEQNTLLQVTPEQTPPSKFIDLYTSFAYRHSLFRPKAA